MALNDQLIEQLTEAACEHNMLVVPPHRSLEQALERRVRRGTYAKIAAHMFAPFDWWMKRSIIEKHQALIATYHRLHPDAVFAGASALLIHNVSPSADSLQDLCVHIATPSRAATKSSEHVRRHAVKDIQSSSEIVEGYHVLKLEHLLRESVQTLDFFDAIGLLYHVCERTKTSVDALAHYIGLHPYVRGNRRMRALLYHLNMQVENAGEAKVFAAISRLGYKLPAVQQAFYNTRNPSNSFRVDFCWKQDDAYIALEFDGIKTKRLTQAATPEIAARTLQREIERVADLFDQGVRFIKHVTYGQVRDPRILSSLLASMNIRKRRLSKRYAIALVQQ